MPSNIQKEPQFYHPIGNRVDLTALSNTSTADFFRYFITISVETSPGVFDVREFNVYPRPGDGKGEFRLERHLRDFINIDTIKIDEADVQAAPFLEYTLRLFERYQNNVGTEIETNELTAIKRGFNTTFNRDEYLTFAFQDWQVVSVGGDDTRKFLWNIENRTKILSDDIFFIHYIPGVTSDMNLQVRQYSISGSVTSSYFPFTNPDIVSLKTVDLGLILPQDGTINRVDVIFTDAALVPISETKTFEVCSPCSTHTRHKFLYLDSKGSINSINFDKVSRKTTNVDVKSYERYIDSLQIEGARYDTRYFVKSSEEFLVNSDVLNDRSNKMIEDLLRSRRVWLDIRNDERFPTTSVQFMPVEIIDRSYTETKGENSDLKNVSLRYRFTFEESTR